MLLACICGDRDYFTTCNAIVIPQIIKFKMDVVIVISARADGGSGAVRGGREVPLGESSRLHSGARIVTARWTDHGHLGDTFDSILSTI